jgi:hypothetical protein
MAKAHWLEFLPQMYRRMESDGTLMDELVQAQTATEEAIDRYKDQLMRLHPPPQTRDTVKLLQYQTWLQKTAEEVILPQFILMSPEMGVETELMEEDVNG